MSVDKSSAANYIPAMADNEAKEQWRGVVACIAGIRERANLIIERELQERGLAGIVPAHGPVLGFLFRQTEPVPIKSLVQKVGRVKSTVTGIVYTLERHGYLSKQGCEEDARSIRVSLTEKGRALEPHVKEISETLLRRVFGDMPLADRERLMELLGVVSDNLER